MLALEDIDGGPSFLEKALRFLEKFGKATLSLLKYGLCKSNIEILFALNYVVTLVG